jgi:molybdopterin-binding protein
MVPLSPIPITPQTARFNRAHPAHVSSIMRISARNRIKGSVVDVKKRATTSRWTDMRVSLPLALLLLGTASVHAAEEPSGCDKFKWDIAQARAALTAPDRTNINSGSELAAVPSTGLTLALATPAEAKLPSPPERAPKEGTFAGFANFKAVPKGGIYTISLSEGAWVDVVQDGHVLKPKGFSGATDCEGIRKTMKYELAASPFVLQISGAKDKALSIAILPSE